MDISRATRTKFLTGRSKSATFIDLFCGPGRARVKRTGEWIDGSAVAAWKISQKNGAPFSDIYIADLDAERLEAIAKRLARLGAPVTILPGSAIEAARSAAAIVNRYGLHCAFIDPYSLGALDFSIFRSLATLRRIDMLVHLSAMDLRRNLKLYLHTQNSPFDRFAPGWREQVHVGTTQREIRRQIVEYWRELIQGLGKDASTRAELINGSNGQALYWLLLVASSQLAHSFWESATDTGQRSLF